jgi:hypothetical protein
LESKSWLQLRTRRRWLISAVLVAARPNMLQVRARDFALLSY